MSTQAAVAARLRLSNALNFSATHVTSMFYGVFLASTLVNVHYLWKYRHTKKTLLIYSILSLITTTIYYGNGTYSQLLGTVDHTPPTLAAAGLQGSLTTINALLTDAVLIYRCYIIWNSNKVILILSCIGWIGMLATGITTVVIFVQPGAGYSNVFVQRLLISNLSISLGLNIILPLLIAGRLLYYRVQFRSVLGAQPVKQYASIAAVIVESSTVYGVAALATIISYAANSIAFDFLSGIIGIMATLSASWIIYRVSRGMAATSDQTTVMSQGMVFANNAQATSTRLTTVILGTDLELAQKGSRTNSETEQLGRHV